MLSLVALHELFKLRKEVIRMHPSETMEETIDGKVYRVKSATLIADDEYWDGHNFEHGGTNAFLYKTPKGNYFTVHLNQWEG